MSFCQMDLGASAWRWDRLTEEDWRFGTIDEGGDGQASDGIMASVLQQKGWKVGTSEGAGKLSLTGSEPTSKGCTQEQHSGPKRVPATPCCWGPVVVSLPQHAMPQNHQETTGMFVPELDSIAYTLRCCLLRCEE
jgi:hypothetical protein